MDVSGALTILANWLKPLGSGAAQVWDAIPADWRVPAAAGFLVAAIAAVVGVLNYQRTYARLDISVMADPFGQKFGDIADECPFNLIIVNPATSTNALRRVECRVDGKLVDMTAYPVDLLQRKIEGGTKLEGCLTLLATPLLEGFKKIEFVILPVRGKPSKFTFREAEVLPRF